MYLYPLVVGRFAKISPKIILSAVKKKRINFIKMAVFG